MQQQKKTARLPRIEHDYYPSPHWFLSDLLRYIRIFGRIGEPCCGDGAIANLLPYWYATDSVWTNDIDTKHSANYYLDATLSESWQQFPSTDWIVTNPPFNQARSILENAYRHAKVGVVMFLRLSFIEPCNNRVEFLSQYPPTTILIQPRYAFRPETTKTDRATMAAFIWDKRVTQQRFFIRPQEDILAYHKHILEAPPVDEVRKIIEAIAFSASVPAIASTARGESDLVSTYYLPVPSGCLTQTMRGDKPRIFYTYKVNGKTKTHDATSCEVAVRKAIEQERGIRWIVEEIFKG